MTVDSTLGDGTTFTILLPASEHSEVATIKASISNWPSAANQDLMAIDDEDFIRDLASAMLVKLGYEVALAEDGQTALAMYRDALEAGAAFNAVILDLTVPGGMGGKAAMRQLLSIDPNVRAIVSSGYSNDPGDLQLCQLRLLRCG